MTVADILRRKRTRIATVRMGETVATAARLLRAEAVGALVVTDVCDTEGHVAAGMFSERDVVHAVADHGAAGLALRVGALISVQRLVACRSTDTLDHVRGLMADHHIRHLPVIDDHVLVGVISMRDVNAAAGREAEAARAAPAASAVA
jgi:CBS domain-containing protein